ncbi:hypothetical protein COT66_01275 [Candidatus Shapirobacteria bacterium CG09_land_8_20_14_0_10_49_15]|uniref:TVP38/TMEM64 family membrane protein n=2 Tax=Candidatus Shapironibacteriota TaxID=1752721 RepID=A0A2M8L6F2_9BACT|nr:MAG: hypothetical protein COT66_01275 [Candidatus Shapirobacteria bacterium CG09_land_8_20_14_0_10_49_15]PJE69819.1 MAG: hypothetical protein COU97_03000 [Candidatus Shapirobacteria bacterium CG10_big_fil_rev_8_21_14_0_10_48_15]
MARTKIASGAWLAAGVSIAIFGGLFWLSTKISPDQIKLFLEQFGLLAPLVYISVMGLTQILAPLNGTVILLAGFVLFGSQVQIYNYLATVLTAATNFLIARRWGRDLVEKLAGQQNLAKVDQFSQNYGVKTLIFLRLFQGHLHDFVSYAYGLTKIDFRTYMLISVLGPIPWLLVWQLYFFPRLAGLAQFAFWYGLTLIPFLLVSTFFLAKTKKQGKI